MNECGVPGIKAHGLSNLTGFKGAWPPSTEVSTWGLLKLTLFGQNWR